LPSFSSNDCFGLQVDVYILGR